MPGDPGDHEPGGDAEGGAWIEWHNLRGSQKGGPNIASDNEDDELAGDETDGQFGEDEEAALFARLNRGPGCIIADSDKAVDDERCDENSEDGIWRRNDGDRRTAAGRSRLGIEPGHGLRRPSRHAPYDG